MPDVSVLTPSFQYGEFIEDAIRSVQRQQGVTAQHIVQDGGSTDATVDVLRRYEQVVWRSEKDGGQSDALNRAIALADGVWVGWLNADEFYLPNGLRRLLAVAVESQADVVFGDTVLVDRSGNVARLLPSHPLHAGTLRTYGCSITSCAMLARRDVLGAQPWRPEFRVVMDWELYLRLERQKARFLHVPLPVAAFRLHDGQVTARLLERTAEEDALLRATYGTAPRFVRHTLGRCWHGLEKIASGAFYRQLLARRFRGRNVRWFASPEGRATVEALERLCSGKDADS